MRFSRLAAASAALTMAMGALMAPPSLAAEKVHDLQFTAVGDANDAVRATGFITGLGTQNVELTLVAVAEFDCQNKGNKTPKGLHRSTSGTNVATEDDNGRIDIDVTTAPLKGCPGKMKPINVKWLSAELSFRDPVTHAELLPAESGPVLP